MVKETSSEIIWDILAQVPDPEIPVVSIVDLGIVRDVQFSKNIYKIMITPTYSGCPAISFIKDEIVKEFKLNNINNYKIETILSPPWTTDWMNSDVKSKLKEAGISPPADNVICPQCDSAKVEVISNFGSTSCKAFYRCIDCKEPFQHFKKI